MTNLIGNLEKYLEQIEQYELRDELKRFKHAIRFPINPETPNIHIAGFYGETNYCDPNSHSLHFGVDIQVQKGTPVIASERSVVAFLNIDDSRDLRDILLYSYEKHIFYGLCHLDKNSIPKKIATRTDFDPNSGVFVEEGEVVGRIGEWSEQLGSNAQIPNDVLKIYGRNYDHLHVLIYHDHDGHVPSAYAPYFNPLLLFKQLAEINPN